MADSKPKPRNPALRMLGLPALPRKLPSRNWLIFWTVSTTLSAGIIYDRREKRRATARWAASVAHLAREPLPHPSAMPRRLTVFLEAPPGDGLRVAQDHFADYIKPILASSGLDWEFAVGRQQGDIRAVVAERVRRERRAAEGLGEADLTEADVVRRRNGIAEYAGVKGDIVVGRHTWKEYVRGLHEGWLGPLTLPSEPESATENEAPKEQTAEDDKPLRPPQPRPYNTTAGYPSSSIPLLIPAELAPSTTISFPHILGFLTTPTRMRRFFGRRYLADQIGREVAAVCLATYREYREENDGYEQEAALVHEEKDWLKSVWKEDPPPKAPDSSEGGDLQKKPEPPKERIWASPMVLDSRIATRMRTFELLPADEERAKRTIIPEEQVEGWIKGKLRGLWRYGARKWKGDTFKPSVGNIDNAD